MTKYEYHTLTVSEEWLTQNSGGDANHTLNGFGADGWDIAAVMPRSEKPGAVIFLRRPTSTT